MRKKENRLECFEKKKEEKKRRIAGPGGCGNDSLWSRFGFQNDNNGNDDNNINNNDDDEKNPVIEDGWMEEMEKYLQGQFIEYICNQSSLQHYTSNY